MTDKGKTWLEEHEKGGLVVTTYFCPFHRWKASGKGFAYWRNSETRHICTWGGNNVECPEQGTAVIGDKCQSRILLFLANEIRELKKEGKKCK